jgi:hypothetical protein
VEVHNEEQILSAVRSIHLNEVMESHQLPFTATSRKDGVPVAEDLDNLDDDGRHDEVMIRTPSVYSWGRCDTNALLRSYNEPPAIDGVQVLTFANNRTIMQVKRTFVELGLDWHYSQRFWCNRIEHHFQMYALRID